MLDLGFIRDIRKHRRRPAGPAPVLAVLRHHAGGSGRAGRRPAAATRCASRSRGSRRPTPKIEQSVHFVPQAGKRALLADLLADPAFAARHRVHPHQARRQPGGRRPRGRRPPGRRAARQQEPGAAREGARPVPDRPRPRAGRDRHRRPRHRRHRHLACHQLRPAGRTGELRPPHRPHRARRRGGHRDLVLRQHRGLHAARDRAPAWQPDHRRRRQRAPAGSQGRAPQRPSAPGQAARRRRYQGGMRSAAYSMPAGSMPAGSMPAGSMQGGPQGSPATAGPQGFPATAGPAR